ncbi:MAG: rRNA adenine N(6)-methyltransferase family protein [Chloroflexi bacterium]|nr:rRNA adenine N(6)-methyltransferase family protein [Chloroflexota bacterium]
MADAILDRASIGLDDVVYEIGPGEGVITDRLARRCRHVVAVEKDARLAERLRRRFAHRPNVTVYYGDFLEFPLPVTRFKVFANVPFNVTAAIIGRITQAAYPPEDAYLAVQREAAHRFLGRPHQPHETLVSVRLKPWFEPSVVHHFARRDFVPEPGIDVVLLRLRKRGPPLLPASEAQPFRDFVAYGFTAWRPSLRRAYAGILDARVEAWLRQRVGPELELDLGQPPSRLPFEGWLVLFRCFVDLAGPAAREQVAGAEARLRQQQAGLQKVHRTRNDRRP